MLLATLPTDLIHDILLKVENRISLAAFISSNHHVNGVFKTHPNSILRQVFCNEIGMDIRVLPYAWAHLKYLGDARLPLEMTPPVRNTVPGIKASLTVSVNPYVLTGLRQGHQLVSRMAQYYSIRCKDGRVLRDTLTFEESCRFHIAAYLFCHYQTIWRSFQIFHLYNPIEREETEEEEYDVHPQDVKTMSACHDFLENLSTNELFWMQEIREFLLQDINYGLNLKNEPKFFSQAARLDSNYHGREFSLDFWRHHLLSTSLAYFRQWKAVLKNGAYIPMRLEKDELWLTDAISLVLCERDVPKQAKDDPDAMILQSRGILIPACQKCGEEPQASQNFYNKTNLDEVRVIWDYRRLPGNLSSNPAEMRRIINRVCGPHRSFANDKIVIIKEIMAHAESKAALRLATGEHSNSGVFFVDNGEDEEEEDLQMGHTEPRIVEKTPNDYQWSPDDVLCPSCFSTIFEGLYCAWWLDERNTNRVDAHIFIEPCPRGFRCPEQRMRDHSSHFDVNSTAALHCTGKRICGSLLAHLIGTSQRPTKDFSSHKSFVRSEPVRELAFNNSKSKIWLI